MAHDMPEPEPSPGPSANLVQSLLSLSNSFEQLGISRHQSKQTSLVQASLRQFIAEIAGDGWERNSIQSLHDLAFLRKLADLQGGEWTDIWGLLDDKIEANVGYSFFCMVPVLTSC